MKIVFAIYKAIFFLNSKHYFWKSKWICIIFIASFPIDDTSSSLVPNAVSFYREAAFKASKASLLYEEN